MFCQTLLKMRVFVYGPYQNHTDNQPTLMSTITDRRTWDLGQHKGVVSTNGNISYSL